MKIYVYDTPDEEITAASLNTLKATAWRLVMVVWFGTPYVCGGKQLSRYRGKVYLIND